MTFNIPSHWKLNQDGSYDVKGNVRIKNTDLVKGKLPVKFGQVVGDFDCDYCTGLTSLLGAPKSVVGDFDCQGCTDLKTLEGAPQSVDGNFNCVGCEDLTSLMGAPQVVDGDFYCDDCTGLKSLQGIEHTKGIKTFCIPPNLESNVLGLFYTGCREVVGEEPWVQVVNKYILLGQKGLVQCSIALVKAGYKELAQL